MANDINLFKTKDSLYLKKIKTKREIDTKEVLDGFILESDEKESRKIIEFLKNATKRYKIGIIARDESFNRRAIETLKFDYLISPEINFQKDTLKQRSSGLNHVLVKEASKKNIAILTSLESLKTKDKKEKSLIISRIIQNVKLCRKARCSFKLANLSKDTTISELARKKIAISWGLSSQQIKDCCTF